MNRQSLRAVAAIGALALTSVGAFAACGSEASPEPAAVTSSTPAAELRSSLNAILQEHVNLASAATGAALDGRNEEFAAAAAALDANSVDLAKMIGVAYGPAAEEAFLPGWRRHIGFFVDYTNGAATRDEAKKAKAKADLAIYAQELATLFNAANGLPHDTLVEIVGGHVDSLTAVIDAQAAGDDAKAFVLQREAASHMSHFADPLTEATVKKFPEKFKS